MKKAIDVKTRERVCVSVPELAPEEVKRMRENMGLSQFEFSVKYGIPINTLRAWEQGTRVPRERNRLLLQKLFAR